MHILSLCPGFIIKSSTTIRSPPLYTAHRPMISLTRMISLMHTEIMFVFFFLAVSYHSPVPVRISNSPDGVKNTPSIFISKLLFVHSMDTMDKWKRDIIVVVVILIVAGVGGWGGWHFFLETQPVKERTAAMGDRVIVDYIGWFEDGRVFDTSLPAVAVDNATYPKAPSFTFRGIEGYKPFEFTIGQGVITGWSEGTIGMKVKETKTIIVPPEKGYGLTDMSKVHVMDLVESHLIIETTSVQWFKDNYSRDPFPGVVVKDKDYGWDKCVLSVQGDVVTLRNEPAVGALLNTTWPWKVKVSSVDSGANSGFGEIKVVHMIDPSAVNNTKGTYKGQTFYLTGLDLVRGKFTIDLNDFVVGKTLIFRITLLKFV